MQRSTVDVRTVPHNKKKQSHTTLPCHSNMVEVKRFELLPLEYYYPSALPAELHPHAIFI